MSAPDLPATIAAPVEHENVVSKSRFIAQAHPVSSPEDAAAIIADIRRQYWDARHNCLAMITGVDGDQARSSDDGEPAGTAGAPMLAVLRHRRLTDLVVVVTRYFGGVKLGAGGLIRAYSTATSDVLDRATLVRREVLTAATVCVPHADSGRLEHLLREWAASHGSAWDAPAYTAEGVELRLWVPAGEHERLRADLAAFSAGSLGAEFGVERVVDVPSRGGALE